MNRRSFIKSFGGILSLSAFFPLPAISQQSLWERLGPVEKGTGFKMDGYYVWDGSVLKVGDRYHLFASRWRKGTTFSFGYLRFSEIIRASSKTPEGPYTFQEVVISQQGPGRWDSDMVHNPVIYQVGGKFVLFYIGTAHFQMQRQIGIATANSIEGPWQRRDKPLDLGINTDANNPSAFFEADGSIKLVWRDRNLRARISVASSYEGPYAVANDNVFPWARIEDFFFFKQGKEYFILLEDNEGKITGRTKWGTILRSPDGIHNWEVLSPAVAYDHSIKWADGSIFQAQRRERPWLLIEDGKAHWLFTAVWDGKDSWIQPVPIIPGFEAVSSLR